MTPRINIDPYYTKIADHYWNDLDLDVIPHMTIWDWLQRDYGVIKIGPRGSKQENLVSFPDEATKTLFLLRWS